MTRVFECPQCGEEFMQNIELYIDDGDVVCSDLINCPHCELEIAFSVDVEITAVSFLD